VRYDAFDDALDGPGWEFDPDALPRVISRAEALRRGLSDDAVERRVRSGRWRRLAPRTYLTRPTCTDDDRLAAALLFAGPGSALSGAAALWAYGVPKIDVPPRILVLVPPTTCVRPTASVHVRRTQRRIVVALAPGPRRVPVERALVDHALGRRRLDDVRAVTARVVQRRLCTVAELGAELAVAPRRGSKNLRIALEEVGWGAESAPEAKAARVLRRAGITDFEQNAVITLPDGTTRRVDFYWRRLRAVLEIDSVEYHFRRADWAGTWDRHLDLSILGYAVIHRPPSALLDPARFVSDIRAWLAGREFDLRQGLA
jgi:very-short-patch-repair endonuclease